MLHETNRDRQEEGRWNFPRSLVHWNQGQWLLPSTFQFNSKTEIFFSFLRVIPGNWISRERDLFRLLRWSMKSTQSVQLNNIWRCVRPKKPVIHILWKTNKYNHEWHPTYFDASSLKLLIQAQICALIGIGFNYKASTGKISTYWIQVVANKRCKCLENRISKVNIACSWLPDSPQNQISSLATQTVKDININDTSASWLSQKTRYTTLNNKSETQHRLGWKSVQYGAIIGQIKHHMNTQVTQAHGWEWLRTRDIWRVCMGILGIVI